jgi:hypothetical protein
VASNIFSFEALGDCKESNLRSAKRIKRLANIKLMLSKTEGKKTRNKK